MMKFLVIPACLVTLLTGCSSAGDLERRGPLLTRSSALTADQAANCLVRELDRRSIDTTGLGKTISHRIDTRVIGQQYRVTHADVITVASQTYMIDVSSQPGGSRLDGYSAWATKDLVTEAIGAC